MHRAVRRAIRGAVRKVRENCPALCGEEVRQQNKSKEDFLPPKHTWNEAIGWTTGIVLTYEFIHRRRGLTLEDSPISASKGLNDHSYSKRCPFRLTTYAIAQPILSTVSNVFGVNHHRTSTQIQPRNSIDITPFVTEKESFLFKDENELLDSHRHSYDDDDDDGIQFDENISKIEHIQRTGPKDLTVASTAEKISGDIFGALGAFKYLIGDKSKKEKITIGSSTSVENIELPSMSAIELMEKGAELGSRRSLYNLGVSYDRLNETKTAIEYYKRAADLGHPLASYNIAVLSIQDGKIGEGLALMHVAAEHGVEEAKVVIQNFK